MSIFNSVVSILVFDCLANSVVDIFNWVVTTISVVSILVVGSLNNSVVGIFNCVVSTISVIWVCSVIIVVSSIIWVVGIIFFSMHWFVIDSASYPSGHSSKQFWW